MLNTKGIDRSPFPSRFLLLKLASPPQLQTGQQNWTGREQRPFNCALDVPAGEIKHKGDAQSPQLLSTRGHGYF